jgi:hypothetical protein
MALSKEVVHRADAQRYRSHLNNSTGLSAKQSSNIALVTGVTVAEVKNKTHMMLWGTML